MRVATEVQRRTRFAIAVAVSGLLEATPMHAHHAFSAEYDAEKPIHLRGTLVKWEMINPHSWFHVEVKRPDGKVDTWMIEGGSPNQLIRLGVTKNSVPIGLELVIDGYQAKDGSNKGVGRNFILPDGRRMFLGGSAPGATPTVK
jgi:hypothetical protein